LTTPLGLRIKEMGGEDLEIEAMQVAPIAVGAAIVTEGGPLTAPHLIHVPVAVTPGGKIAVENIRRAARAALIAGNVKGFDSLALPPLCRPEDSGVPVLEIARAIIDEVRGHRHSKPERIFLVDDRRSMIEAVEKILSSLK
jgi:O-acetyl-ADP-ribose deacetylase (regulator of RNase III)